jgi:hypothetical protein
MGDFSHLKSSKGFTMVGAMILAAVVLAGTVASFMVFNNQVGSMTGFSRQGNVDIVANSVRSLLYDIPVCNTAIPTGYSIGPSPSPNPVQINNVILNGAATPQPLKAGAVFGKNMDDTITINSVYYSGNSSLNDPVTHAQIGWNTNLNIVYTQSQTSSGGATHVVVIPLAFATNPPTSNSVSACLTVGIAPGYGPNSTPAPVPPWNLCQYGYGSGSSNLGGTWSSATGSCTFPPGGFVTDAYQSDSSAGQNGTTTSGATYAVCGLQQMESGGADFYEQCGVSLNQEAGQGYESPWTLTSGNGYNNTSTSCGMRCVRGTIIIPPGQSPPPGTAPAETPSQTVYNPGCAPDCTTYCLSSTTCKNIAYNLSPSPVPTPPLTNYQQCLANCQNELTANSAFNYTACVQGCLYVSAGVPSSTCDTFCHNDLGFSSGTCEKNVLPR